MSQYIHLFFSDTRVQIALLLLAVNFVLGVCAAAIDKKQSFRLVYIADTLRADVLSKFLPFFILYGAYLYAGNTDIVIPGFDMEVLMNSAYALLVAYFVASILSSLKDLGLVTNLPVNLNGGDPTTATPLPPKGNESA